MFRKYLLSYVLREGEGGGGAAPNGGTGAPPAGQAPAFTPVAAPWAGATDKPWTIGDTGRPWHETIPEDPVRELIGQKGYRTPAELAVAYHNANKIVSNPDGFVELPREGDQASFDKFAQKLGRPDSPDKYEFKFGEGVTADENMTKFGKQLAYDLGLPPAMAQKMADKWNEFAAQFGGQAVAAQNEQMRAQNDQALAALQTQYGDKFNEAVAAGKRTAEALQLDKGTLDAIEKNIGAAPLVDLLARVGMAVGEKGMVPGPGGGSGDPASLTPEAADARITQLRGNSDFMAAYGNKAHPQHAEKVREMEALYARRGRR